MPRTALAVLLLAAVACATGCTAGADVPDRPADVTGVVAGADVGGDPVLADPSDGYYEGMSLLRGEPVVVGPDGQRLEPADLSDGDAVEVWVDGACAESFPVQCGIAAVRVTG